MVRPWKTGTAAQRAANATVSSAGDLGTTSDTGDLVVGDGVSTWAALKRMVRLDELQAAVTLNADLTAMGVETGYIYAITDANGRIAFSVGRDGTFAPTKPVLPAGSVPLSWLAASVQAGVGQQTPAELNIPIAFTDTNSRLLGYFAADGTLTPSKLNVPTGSIPLTALASSVQAGIGQPLPSESGMIEAAADSAGRIYRGVKTDGTTFGKGIGPAGGPVAIDATWIIDTTPDANGNSQLRATSRATGQSTLLTSIGRNLDPVLISGGLVVYRSDGGTVGGKFNKWVVPAAGGTPAPLFSLSSPIYCPGDSLTAGSNSSNGGTYPTQLGYLLGQYVVNDGSGGQTSTQIVARAGSVPATVTFTSNSIAATTAAQTVTVNVDLLYGAAGGYARPGSIGGIHGTLASGGTGGALTAYTFTRDTAGTAVSLSGATAFLPDTLQYASQMQSIMLGRNNFKTDTTTKIVSDAQSIVTLNTALSKRYWVFAIPPFTGGEETNVSANTQPGGGRYLLDAANAALAAAFPTNWISSANLAGSPLMTANPALNFTDSAAFLRTDIAFTLAAARYPAAGITKTTQDTTDIANGVTPTTFRTNTTTAAVDGGHLNEYGYYLWAYLAYQFITAKGWLL